jgi:ubiquinone/menaquinone biosynthesis C-methylase UbiE
MTQVSNPVFARIFPRMSRAMEAGGIAARRGELLSGLAGQVIDIGAGTGPSFGRYQALVTRVLAVEPEPRLRRLASTAARTAPVPVEVTGGLAGALPADDASFDAAVVCYVLCTVRTRTWRWPRCAGYCGPAASCASSSTSAPTPPGSPASSAH